MINYVNAYSHTVPLFIKLFCSFFMWFPILIPFVSLWYFPFLTIIFNIIVYIYTIIVFCSTHFSALLVWIKQKRIHSHFFRSAFWIDQREAFQRKQSSIQDILHMIVIPIYKEDLTILDATLKSLSEQHVSMLVGLALEEREINSDTKYDPIINKYQGKFIKIIKTIHPVNLPNETPGKASNCNHCLPVLVRYYEEHYKNIYPYVMITSCDCDTIWCEDYFLYLNYLCTKNGMESFHRTTYVPIISNLKNVVDNHMISNWMSVIRSISLHGHFRRFGIVRTFVSEYHVPLDLMKKIDYWDGDLVHEDIHMQNKLAILDNESVLFKQTYLPCDNQIPTDAHSAFGSLVVLWKQSLRWNLFVYDLYYLFHVWLMNIFQVKSYEHFRANSWKILKEIVNNYENLFYIFFAPIFNQIFWIYYFCRFDHQPYNHLTDFLMNYVQPRFLILQIFFSIVNIFAMFYTNAQATKGKSYSWKKFILFVIGFLPFYFVAFIYQMSSVLIAWVYTLRSSNVHAESATKIMEKFKDK